MLAFDWGTLGGVVLAGACVGLVARLMSVISSGTKKSFNSDVGDEVNRILISC